MFELAILAAIVYLVGRRFGYFRDQEVREPQVTVGAAPAEPWITKQKEQEIVKWIRSGGLRK